MEALDIHRAKSGCPPNAKGTWTKRPTEDSPIYLEHGARRWLRLRRGELHIAEAPEDLVQHAVSADTKAKLASPFIKSPNPGIIS